jgi:hypothetical protein
MSTYFSIQGFKAKRNSLKQQIRKTYVLNQISIHQLANPLIILGLKYNTWNLLIIKDRFGWKSQINPGVATKLIPYFFQ